MVVALDEEEEEPVEQMEASGSYLSLLLANRTPAAGLAADELRVDGMGARVNGVGQQLLLGGDPVQQGRLLAQLGRLGLLVPVGLLYVFY